MTYAVKQDLIDRFGEEEIRQLTDRINIGAIDDTVVSGALTDADDEINAYVATRYTLPFASPPKILKRVAGDIARYFLFEDRASEQVKARYDAAIKFLKSVSDGTTTLGLDSTNTVAETEGGPAIDSNDRVFTQGRASTNIAGTLDDY